MLGVGTAIFGVFFFVTLFVQDVWGYSVTGYRADSGDAGDGFAGRAAIRNNVPIGRDAFPSAQLIKVELGRR